MDDMRPQGVQAPNDGPGHEPDRFSIRGIVVFAVILAAVTGGVMLGIGAMMGVFSVEEKRAESNRPALFNNNKDDQFSGPQLQQDPARDMTVYRNQVEATLDGYGWTDPKARVAHIPIGRAMDLLAKSGLPSRAETSEPKSAP